MGQAGGEPHCVGDAAVQGMLGSVYALGLAQRKRASPRGEAGMRGALQRQAGQDTSGVGVPRGAWTPSRAPFTRG